MPGFPAGTVTFLFTDIEQSAVIWERNPVTARVVVERQFALLRQHVQANNGVLYKIIGDATQSAFATAAQGIAAALAAQRALTGEPWPSADERPRVRMALHAGAAEPQEGDYLAPALNRLSRLLDAAHGEQILTSEIVADLASGLLPPGASLVRLGEFRLRDLLQPEEVFQLCHPDLRAEFPPLNTPGRLPHNLPAQPTPFLGREREVEEVIALLQQPGVRLVTLTGPGGVGKTRLGLRVAAEALESFPDGAYLVDLARQTDPDLIPSATATALGLREQPGQSLLETMTGYLQERQVLILFDNFEHVLPAATFVADLLAGAPKVTALATSRARLGLQAEHEYRVETLPIPDLRALPPLEELAQYDAIALFVSRARALRPDFTLTAENAAAVAAICARVDGLPLAIELAAARIKLLSPEALRDRLERRLSTLTGGARDLPPRQRTLRDTIAWSHDLLSSEEAALLRRLSLFPGGWTLEGAEAVGDVDPGAVIDPLAALAGLVDQSLVDGEPRRGAATEPRYVMLETIREFAAEQLTAFGERDRVWQAFAAFLVGLAEAAERGLKGPEQPLWLDRLDREHANIRAALSAALEQGDAATALGLASRLWDFWRIRGFLAEGSSWLERALGLAGTADPEQRAAAELGLGKLAIDLGDYEAAARRFETSIELWSARGNRARVADAKSALMIVKLNTGELDAAHALGQEALETARELGDTRGTATALYNLGILARENNEIALAIERLDEALKLWRAVGDPKWIGLTTVALGISHRRAGNIARARQDLDESDAIYRRQENPFQRAIIALERGLIENDAGQPDQAIRFHAEALHLFDRAGAPLGIIEAIEWIAVTLAAKGESIPALQLFGATSAAREARCLPPPQESEATIVNAGLLSATLAAGSEAESTLNRGRAISLEEARDLAQAISLSRGTS
jgi:predicted ATPase/class 3 adenylate cyclase